VHVASLSEEHYRMYDSSENSKSAQYIREQERKRSEDAWRNRDLILTLYQERGSLEDVWSTSDPLKSGFISYVSLLNGLKRVRADMGKEELKILLELLNLNGEPNNGSRLFPQDSSMFVQRQTFDESSSYDGDSISVVSAASGQMRINYVEAVRRIVVAAGVAKRSEIKTKLTPKIFQDPDGLDNLEKVCYFVFLHMN
jgi:hypothetical protein